MFYLSIIIKRKNSVLTTPTKQAKEQLTSESNSEDDSNLDLNFFIENLCQKDFAQKLAESINELNSKKSINSNTSCDASQIESYNESTKITTSNKTNETEQIRPTVSSNEQILIDAQIVSNEQQTNYNNDLIQNQQNQTEYDNFFMQSDENVIFYNIYSLQNIWINYFFLNKKRFAIGNEDISLLAEHFSEPVFETLYNLIYTSK